MASESESAGRVTTLLFMQFAKFASVGVVGTVGHYLTLTALVELFSVPVVIAATAGALVGALINYTLSRRAVFTTTRSHREALPKFLFIAAIGLGLNALVLAGLLKLHFAHYLVCQVIATGIVLVWNFVGNKLWTFR
jgi:putative flippase GtrA